MRIINKKKIKITLHTKIFSNIWIAFAKPAKYAQPGATIHFEEKLSAKVVKKSKSHVELFFNFSQKKFYDFLESFGSLPIPPYIKSFNSKDKMKKTIKVYFLKIRSICKSYSKFTF